MNLCLLDPFQSDFPEVIEEYLEHGITKCIAFNRRGTLLAAGCTDGTCVIWDFDTRGVAKELRDPDCGGPVTSVSWSKCGHRLLSASTDKLLVLWEVATGAKLAHVVLKQAALHCILDPGRALPTLCLACPLNSGPIIVDFAADTQIHTLPVVSSASNGDGGGSNRGKHGDASAGYSLTTASFNKKGDLIYVGNSKGEILIIDKQLREVKTVITVPGGSAIRHIVFSRNGQYLLTNSSDRIIRVFENLLPRSNAAAALSKALDSHISADRDRDAGNGKPCESQFLRMTREYLDSVNRMHWKAACFNGDGEYVVGASANKGEHKIHIWNRNFGQLARLLEGPKEGLSDLAWHPTRPVVASVSMSGAIYLWAKDYTENWSAFAPDFKELEENEEYVEREDEFDIVPDASKAQVQVVEDDIEVDIITTEKVAAFSDSDESEDGLYFLPTAPIPDEPREMLSIEQPPTPPKPSSSSATESDRSASEPDPSSQQMDLDTNQVVSSTSADGEIGANGRIKRKRKLSEKAAELQAEKGRKTSQKVNVPNPKPKVEGNLISPNGVVVLKGSSEKASVRISANTSKDVPRTIPKKNQGRQDAFEFLDDE